MRDIDTQKIIEAYIFKVNFKGKKRKKLSCPPGYHPNSDGTACVPMSAEMKKNLKLGARQSKRTKVAMGLGYLKRVARKMKRAKKFRASYGLSNGGGK